MFCGKWNWRLADIGRQMSDKFYSGGDGVNKSRDYFSSNH